MWPSREQLYLVDIIVWEIRRFDYWNGVEHTRQCFKSICQIYSICKVNLVNLKKTFQFTQFSSCLAENSHELCCFIIFFPPFLLSQWQPMPDNGTKLMPSTGNTPTFSICKLQIQITFQVPYLPPSSHFNIRQLSHSNYQIC